MDWFVKAFVKASLFWLGLGVTLGVCMAAHPAWTVYRPAHAHMNLLGFVTMMIYGVAYHIIPRFTGHALFSRRIAGWQWGISNVGLAGMVTGFGLRPHVNNTAGASLGTIILASGGVLAALGAYMFIYNIWRTIDAQPAPRPVAPAASGRR